MWTTSIILMTSKVMSSHVLAVCLVLLFFSGCASLPSEPPLCVPVRDFVLVAPSVSDQLAMKDASPSGFAALATNDTKLKSQIRVLESIIALHDEPLGDCD